MISERAFQIGVGFLLKNKELVLLTWALLCIPASIIGPKILVHQSLLQRLPQSQSGDAMDRIALEFPKYSDRFHEVISIWCEDCTTIIGRNSRTISDNLDRKLRDLSLDHYGLIKGWEGYYENENHPQRFLSEDRKMMLFHWNGDITAPDAMDVYDQVDQEVSRMNEEFARDGVHVVSVGIIAQYTATNRMMQQIMKKENVILVPLIGVVLWIMIGNLARVCIPFICATATMVISWWALYSTSKQFDLNVVALVPFFLICSSFALAIDYGLFLLTRFREEVTSGHSLEVCIARMLFYSGHVTCLSGAVLSICASGYFLFPHANQLQILSYALGLVLNITLSMLTSLTITPCLLACFPHFFDIQTGVQATTATNRIQTRGSKVWKAWGQFVTKSPNHWIIPTVCYLVMLPVAYQTVYLQENLNLQNNFATDTPEFDAYVHMSEKFPVGELEPIYLNLQVEERGGSSYFSGVNIIEPNKEHHTVRMEVSSMGITSASETSYEVIENGEPKRRKGRKFEARQAPLMLAERASGPLKSQVFFEQVCSFIKDLIASSHGRPYQIDGSQIQSVMWNSRQNECVTWEEAKELLRSERQRGAVDAVAEAIGLEPEQDMREAYQSAWRRAVSHRDTATLIEIRPSFDPFGDAGLAFVHLLRSNILPKYEGRTVHEYSLKPTLLSSLSIVLDMKAIFFTNFLSIIALTSFLAFAGIGVVFKSVLVPVKLIMTVALPVVFIYGLAIIIFQYGALNWLGIRSLMNHGSLDWKNPIYNVLILIGLALDYEIFLFARIYEYRSAGLSNKAAIVRAMSQTGPIISAAGMIMAIAFTSFATGPVGYFNEHGFIVIAGILFDTFVVRSCIVPSIMCLWSEANYWPTKMPEPSVFEDDEKPTGPVMHESTQEEARFWLLRAGATK